jgi:hypothetical protein
MRFTLWKVGKEEYTSVLLEVRLEVVERKGAYGVLVGKPEGKSPLEDLGRWEDNIRKGVKEIRWEGMD